MKTLTYWRTVRCIGSIALTGCVSLSTVSAQALPTALIYAQSATGLPPSASSLWVQRLSDPTPLVIHQPDLALNPASVLKLLPTWTALETLGPGYRWQTRILGSTQATSVNGQYLGALVLSASGDPSLHVEDAWTLLRQLHAQGIRSIEGGLWIDRSRFGDVAIDPGAFDGDPSRPYNASPDAFIVGLSATRLQVRWLDTPVQTEPTHLPAQGATPVSTASGRTPHGERPVGAIGAGRGTWQTLLDPPLPSVAIESTVRTAPGRCAGHSPQIRIQKSDGPQRPALVQTQGALPSDCPPFDLWRVLQPPEQHAAQVLQWLWTEHLGGAPLTIHWGKPPVATPNVLAEHQSPPLVEVVRDINKLSNNLMTRQLMLTWAAEQQGAGVTEADAARLLRDWLTQRGLVMPELVIDNGAGLSRDARISARSVAQLLKAAWESPTMPEFMSSLAVVGEDGTARRRFEEHAARGRAHVKTGSLRDVRAMAGYVLSNRGERWIFVSIVNHPQAHQARAFEKALLEWIIKQ